MDRTLDEMNGILAKGSSVLFADGRIATDPSHLPTQAQLARKSADPAKIAATREAIEAQKRALDDQLAELDRPADPEARAPAKPAAIPAQPPHPTPAPPPARPEPAAAPARAPEKK